MDPQAWGLTGITTVMASSEEGLNRGYYTAAQRYEFSFRVVKTRFHK